VIFFKRKIDIIGHLMQEVVRSDEQSLDKVKVKQQQMEKGKERNVTRMDHVGPGCLRSRRRHQDHGHCRRHYSHFLQENVSPFFPISSHFYAAILNSFLNKLALQKKKTRISDT
jgi:hypothetical protein